MLQLLYKLRTESDFFIKKMLLVLIENVFERYMFQMRNILMDLEKNT